MWHQHQQQATETTLTLAGEHAGKLTWVHRQSMQALRAKATFNLVGHPYICSLALPVRHKLQPGCTVNVKGRLATAGCKSALGLECQFWVAAAFDEVP